MSIKKRRAEGDFRDFRDNVEPYYTDNDRPTTFETHKLVSDIVVVERQIASSSICKVCTSGSHAILCQDKALDAAMVKTYWMAVSSIWQSDSTAEPKGSTVRGALKNNPSPLPNRDDMSASPTDRPN